MLKRNDLGRIISERFALRGGKRIPRYLGDWMVDYVFEAIKIGLIEDGAVDIAGHVFIEKVDVPEHQKRMPDDSYITIPAKSKLHTEWRSRFKQDINKGEIKEISNARRKKVPRRCYDD